MPFVFGDGSAQDGQPRAKAAPPLWTPGLEDAGGRFAFLCNRQDFSFAHDLAGCGLFNIPELVGLASRRPANIEYAHWSTGKATVGGGWNQGMAQRGTLEDTLRNIAHNDSLVLLRHCEQDPVFGPLLHEVFEQLVEICGPALRDDMVSGHAEIIISSPGRITSYHMDADCNFLFQIAGRKSVKVYPTRDARVVTDVELEEFHCGDYDGAHYREEHEALAAEYQLAPGVGVHIPSISPHSAVAGDEVCIGLSCAFDMHSVQNEALICQVNRRLRRMGLQPLPPGVSHARDALKLGLKRMAVATGVGRERYLGAAAFEWKPR